LQHFATEANQQHAGVVGVLGVTVHHPIQGFKALTPGHAAAGAVDVGHHPVDVRIVGQFCLGEERCAVNVATR